MVIQKSLRNGAPDALKGAVKFTHSYDFDPTYGMNLEQLLAVAPPEAPSDFADFWEYRYAEARSVAPQPVMQVSERMFKQYAVHELHYCSTGGVEIGGWLMLPVEGKISRGLIIGHGYGGCGVPEEPLFMAETVLLFPCFRGIGRSAMEGVSQDPHFHVLHDIQDKDRYILGGCVEDLWLAVSALLELFPEVTGRLGYAGISLGGGIGALATPWDRRIQRLHLNVPTFGHQALRLTLHSVGSNEAVREYVQHHDINVMETLAYYDAASAMRYLHNPALVAAALFDPAVPPPGQFAVYNAIAKNQRSLFVLEAGHFAYPGQEQQMRKLNQEVVNFFMAL